MKSTIVVILILATFISASSAFAQNKVVVIPLHSAKKLHNVVTVSAKGGDFTDPVAAVESISGASDKNPYLVLIGPGVYPVTRTLLMKPYVTIAGSGREATLLKGSVSGALSDEASALIAGADNAVLCNLTIENTGGGTVSIALYNEGSSPYLHHLTAKASGATYNYGISNQSAASPRVDYITATASGGTISTGIENNAHSAPEMTHVRASGSGATYSYGVVNYSSPAIIRNCVLDGTTAGIYMQGPVTTTVIRSSIIGGAFISSGTLNCVNADDGVDLILDSTCQ